MVPNADTRTSRVAWFSWIHPARGFYHDACSRRKGTDIVFCGCGDDGVMPQTIEAVEHSKAPVFDHVAINKIDKRTPIR